MSALDRVPVFRKDLKLLLRPLSWFVALQLLYVPAVLIVFFGWEEFPPALPEVLMVTGWGLGQLFALVAAAHFHAEERSAGTLTFLRRLPASRRRVYGEKGLAGLAALGLLWLAEMAIQGAGSLLAGAAGTVPAEFSLLRSMAILVGVSTTSYLVGLPLSLAARQSVVVVLGGCAAWFTALGLFLAVGSQDFGATAGLAALVLPIVAALLVVGALPGRGIRLLGLPAPLGGRPPLALIWKGLAENGALIALSLTLLAVAWVAPPSVGALWILAGAIILVTAIGASAYAPLEKRGIHALLYQHPVPRGHIFWSKAAVALVPVLAVSAATALRWEVAGPVPILLVVAFFVYAYACSVLLSLVIERQSTTALGAQCVVTMTLGIPLGLADHFELGTALSWGERMAALAHASTPGFLVLAVGCVVAARMLAGSRAFLTGSVRRRSAWAGGVLVALLLAATLVGSVGWQGIRSG